MFKWHRNQVLIHNSSRWQRAIRPLLVLCWANVVDGGPTLNQQWLNVLCLLHCHHCYWVTITPPHQWKWNESGFRPPLCTYRLNWARRTSWGWWDDWDDTVLQTQNSKFEPWRSEAEHATSRSRRLPTILTFTRGWGRNIFCFLQTAETGNRTPDSGVKGSGANHYPRAPALLINEED